MTESGRPWSYITENLTPISHGLPTITALYKLNPPMRKMSWLLDSNPLPGTHLIWNRGNYTEHELNGQWWFLVEWELIHATTRDMEIPSWVQFLRQCEVREKCTKSHCREEWGKKRTKMEGGKDRWKSKFSVVHTTIIISNVLFKYETLVHTHTHTLKQASTRIQTEIR